MIAPQPDVSSCSIGALAASTEKVMLSWALGTTTSPFQYQSNNSAGLSSGWATKPSSDMHMWVSTLAMPDTTRPAPPTHQPATEIADNVGSRAVTGRDREMARTGLGSADILGQLIKT